MKNSRSYPRADIGSDHNLVMMQCELKYKKLTKKKTKPIEISKLKDPIVKRDFESKTNNALERYDFENKTIEEQWTELKKTIINTAQDVLKKDQVEPRKPWISEEVIELINERRKYKTRDDEEGKRTYRKLRNEIIRKSKRDKDTYLNEICAEINNELNADKLDKAYGMVKKFFGETKKKSQGIQNESGQFLYEEKEIAKRWKTYIEKLYGDNDMDENTLEKKTS